MTIGRLVDGKWTDSDESYRQGGAFVRATPAFRSFITADGSSPFPPEAGRYHLYVALPCPWCHRTMIFHALKRLQGVVSISMVDLLMLEGGWRFKEPDPITGAQFVHQLYTLADPQYTGRVSVPVLWDKETGTIVNNELSDIIRMFNSAFDDITGEHTDNYPAARRPEIDGINKRVYETLNNGVYRCGLATKHAVTHRDSLGNTGRIVAGDVQVMSGSITPGEIELARISRSRPSIARCRVMPIMPALAVVCASEPRFLKLMRAVREAVFTTTPRLAFK